MIILSRDNHRESKYEISNNYYQYFKNRFNQKLYIIEEIHCVAQIFKFNITFGKNSKICLEVSTLFPILSCTHTKYVLIRIV